MRYRYQHWLNRRVGYEAMLSSVRRAVHVAAAEAIERADLAAPGPTRSEADLGSLLARGSPDLDPLRPRAGEIASHWEAGGTAHRSALFLLLHARDRERSGDYAKSMAACQRAAALLGAADPLASALAAYSHAAVLERTSRYPEALVMLSLASKAANEAAGEDAARVTGQVVAARAFVHFRSGALDQAMQDATAAAASARAAHSPADEAAALNTIANVQAARGDWKEAEAAFASAQRLFGEAGDLRRKAATGNNLAEAWRVAGRLADAERGHSESLAIKEAIGDRYGVVASLNNLSLLAEARGDSERSETLLLSALSIISGVSDYGEALCLLNLGTLLSAQDKHAEADDMFQRSLSLRTRIGDRPGMAFCLQGLASSLIQQQRWAEALNHLVPCIAICTELSLRSQLAYSLAIRAEAFRGLGRTEEAKRDSAEALQTASRSAEAALLHVARLSYALCHTDRARATDALTAARESGNLAYERRAQEVLARLGA